MEMTFTVEEKNIIERALDALKQDDLSAKLRVSASPDLSTPEMQIIRAAVMKAGKNMEGVASTDPQRIADRMDTAMAQTENNRSASPTVKQEAETAITHAEEIQKPVSSIIREPAMVELLTGLSGAHNAEQFANVADLMQSVDTIEEQLNAAFAQLNTMKRQIDALKGSISPKQDGVLKQVVQSGESALGKVKEGLHTVKSAIVNAAKNAVSRAKSAGWGMIGKFLSFADLPEKLGHLQNLLGGASKALESGINRVELVGKEFYRADAHRDNALRVLVGKERKEIDQKGISSGAQSVSGLMHGALKAVHKMESVTGRVMVYAQNAERLANAAEKKPSLLKKLHANQEKIVSKAQPEKALVNPEKAR